MIDQPSPGPLAQPTRARLFALLCEIGHPASTAELAERIGLHPNGVRVHLDRLEGDGLLVRSRDRGARGRPRDLWRVAPGVRPGGRGLRAYGDLAAWLARALGSARRSLRSVEATGREIGHELGAGAPASGADAFEGVLTSLGFEPEPARDGARLRLTLRNCPYCEAVRENQPVVCALHRGITRGLLDDLLPGATLAAFEPRDPVEAGCLVELDLVAAAAGDRSARTAREGTS